MAKMLLVNPRKRTRRRSSSKRLVPTSARTVTRKVTRYRRNAAPRTKAALVNTLKSGALGAVGVLGTDMVLARLPLPAQLQTGYGGAATQALVGFALGMAVWKFGKRKSEGLDIARGAATVACVRVAQGLLPSPTIQAPAETGFWSDIPGQSLMGGYFSAAPSFSRPAGFGVWQDSIN